MRELADAARRLAPPPPAGIAIARLTDGRIEVATAGGVPEDAVFELGSITKAVTGLLLADAVARGEVTLDTPLDACLPGTPAIPLVELATHTAGLPRLPLAFLRRAGFRSGPDPYRDTTVEELVRDAQTVRIRRRGRVRYSNFGAALLGQALAARAGGGYETLVHERVLDPLRTTELWAHGGPEPAQPHDRRGRPVPPWTLGAYAPAGCLRGTVRGALSLACALLAPPPELAAAVELALTRRAGGPRLGVGLGWMRAPVGPGEPMWWHNGGTGGSRAFLGFGPDRRHAVACAANAARSVDRAARLAL